MTPYACRLSVLLAREASVGLILRRGPRYWVQCIRWDTATDTFEPGQWFHGRIYDDKCDLSPSGEKFLYFAAKHSKHYMLHGTNPSVGSAWTAVSRVPYLTALALWPNGNTTYYGGGLFAAENELWLSLVSYPPIAPLPGEVTVLPNPAPRLHSEYIRLLRDGWTWDPDGHPRKAYTSLKQLMRDADAEPMGLNPEDLPQDLYRTDPARNYLLHMHLVWRANTYSLRILQEDVSKAIPLEGVEWADWDQRGRLICARDGKLFEVQPGRARRTADLTLEWRELADFRDASLRPQPSPEWARLW